MKNKKHTYPPFNIATSFMLVIFIILCMVVFSVLSLSNAIKDQAYSEKNALRTTSYYDACNRAEEIFGQIDKVLESSNAPLRDLQNIEGITIAEEDNCLNITYAIPIDDSEILEVSLETTEKESDNLIIRSWKQHSATEWTGDTKLPVLDSH